MTPLGGLAFVTAGLALVALALSQAQSRLALVEVMLTEGLPPGHKPLTTIETGPTTSDAASLLGDGTHVFLSRGCQACQRLADELVTASMAPLQVHYIDRAHAVMRTLLAENGHQVLDRQAEIADAAQASPLPFTVAVGGLGLVARGVTSTTNQIRDVQHQAAMP